MELSFLITTCIHPFFVFFLYIVLLFPFLFFSLVFEIQYFSGEFLIHVHAALFFVGKFLYSKLQLVRSFLYYYLFLLLELLTFAFLYVRKKKVHFIASFLRISLWSIQFLFVMFSIAVLLLMCHCFTSSFNICRDF